MKILAAICIESYEMELKLFEIKKNVRKELCCARQRLELGKDTFRYKEYKKALFGKFVRDLPGFHRKQKNNLLTV